MRKILTNIGGFLAISGIISTILYLIDYNVKFLVWIDAWGPVVGWIIRAGLILVGILLFFLAGQSTNEEVPSAED